MSSRERLQQMLFPQSNTTAIDLDELRALMFKGISDIAPQRELQKNNASPTEPSDHIRVLAWRVLLGVVKGRPAEWPKQLEYRRSDYERWKRDFVGGSSSRRGGGAIRSEAEHHSDILLIKEIEKVRPAYHKLAFIGAKLDLSSCTRWQDVFRTRSELAFFSGGSIAMQQMLYILFVFAKLHPDVGYVQGMNEILAPIIYVCSTDPSATCSWAAEVEADAFHCFASVMSSLKVLYGRSPQDPLSGADLQMARFAKLLRQHDPTLWQHLNSVELTPGLYTLRWYMALLAREFSMSDTLRIWDALLADPKRFSFLHYVNCALVRSQRKFLLRNGFATSLKRLQNLQSSDVTLNISDLLSSAEQMRQVDRSLDADTKQQNPVM